MVEVGFKLESIREDVQGRGVGVGEAEPATERRKDTFSEEGRADDGTEFS